MHILHINTYDMGGGAGNLAYELVRNQTDEVRQFYLVGEKRGFSLETEVIPQKTHFKILSPLINKLSQKVFHKGFCNLISAQDKWHCTYSTLSSLVCYQNADIIHLHNIHGGYFDLKAIVPIAKEKPIVWTLHDMWAMTGGEAHTFGGKNYQKGLPEVYGKEFYPLFDPIIDKRQNYLKVKKRLYNELADRITFVPCSYWLESCLRKSYVYNRRLQIQTIHNGIDREVFKVLKRRESKVPTILFFNSDDPFKGCDIFWSIIDKIEFDYNLVVVGKKPDIPITFKYLPYISNRDTLRNLYNEADMMVFPSIAETFPLTTLEAMACGACVVASDVGGIPEQIQNSVTGLLFRTNDSYDLLKTLKSCLGNLNEIRKIGKIASEVARDMFTFTEMSKAYFRLYESLINKRANPVIS